MPDLNRRVVKVKANQDVSFNEVLVGFKVSASVPVFYFVSYIAHWCNIIGVECEVAFEGNVPEDEDMGSSQHKPMQEDLKLLLLGDFGCVFSDFTTILVLRVQVFEELL